MANIEAVNINKISSAPAKQTEQKPAVQTKAPEAKEVTASADKALGNYGKAALNVLSSPTSHNTIAKSYLDGNKFCIEYADGSKRCLGAV